MSLPPLPDLPDALRKATPARYSPSERWAEYAREVFVARGGALEVEEHAPLQHARLGVLLTNDTNETGGRRTIGQARLCEASGSDTWAKGQRAQQLAGWFADGETGLLPDFLVILDAYWIWQQAREDHAAAVLALLDHELSHCAQKHEAGVPQFGQDGRPRWTIAPHDVEEFVGVTRRWGAEATSTTALVEAAAEGPTVAPAQLGGLCGTCGRSL